MGSLFTKSGSEVKEDWLDDKTAMLEWLPKLPIMVEEVKVRYVAPKLEEPYSYCSNCGGLLDLDGEYCSYCVFEA